MRVLKRRRFTPEQRARMVALARGLTGEQAAKKFRVHVMTIYAWRKAANGVAAPRARLNADIARSLRAEVHERVRAILPKIVREEVERALK